jgi:hypothetical protein
MAFQRLGQPDLRPRDGTMPQYTQLVHVRCEVLTLSQNSDVFNFQTSCFTVHFIQKFYVNCKINKSLLKYL